MKVCGKDTVAAFQAHGCITQMNKGVGGTAYSMGLLHRRAYSPARPPHDTRTDWTDDIVHRTAVPIRTPAEYPIRLYEINLRFCRGRDVAPVDSAAGLEDFERRLLELAHLKLRLHPSATSAQCAEYGPSYFAEYRETFCEMLRFQVHETQDDPLMCVFVLHTDSIPEYAWKDELQRLEDGLPSKLKACMAAGTAVRHVVFVGDLDAHEEELRGIGNTLKASSRYVLPSTLCFEHEDEDATNDAPAARLASTRGVDPASFVEIAASVCILPHIESQIRELEVVISASRRGLKNQLKSLLFRRTTSESDISSGDQAAGEGAGAVGGGGEHPHELSATFKPLRRGGVEAAMRQQSDLLMLVGDNGTAISTLKLLSSDLKSDKLPFHYAAAQEALAMASILSGGSVSASIMHLKEAFLRYAEVIERERGLSKSLAALYCTRVALRWALLLESLNRLSEASWIVMRAHFHEGNTRAAFLLEYAAHFLVQQRPAKLRKYGFYLVLAALRYGQSEENSLAFMAHQKAIEVLKDRGWDILEEHVHEALDHEWTALGDDAKALEHAVSMLRCFNLPAHLQAAHMAHVIDVHGKVAKTARTAKTAAPGPMPIGVPVLDTAHAAVLCAGSHDYYDETSRSTSSRVWKDMELDFPRAKALTMHGRHKSGAPGHGTACVGEDIVVKIPVSNPLKVSLEMVDVELLCEMSGEQEERAGRDSQEFQETLRSTTNMILGPGEEDVLTLTCQASAPGSVLIHGVRWNLGGVPCMVEFQPQMSRWSLDPELRPARGGPIDIQIMPPMPRLHVHLSPGTPCPEQMLVGEIARCELTLSNVGSTDLHNVQCVTSRNVYLDGTEPCGEAESCRRYENLSIGVGETRTVDMYVRPEHAGHQDLHVVWRYQATESSPTSAATTPTTKNRAHMRFLRFSKCVYASPSVLEAQALIVDHAAEDDTDMMCFQARTARDHPIQLDSLIISASTGTRTFDLRGISALPQSDGSQPGSPVGSPGPGPGSGSRSANYEFDHRLSAGRASDGLVAELSPAEARFARIVVSANGNGPGNGSGSGDGLRSTSTSASPSPVKDKQQATQADALRQDCGVLRWYTPDSAPGLTVFRIEKSSDQAGLHGGNIVANLVAPTSLQHNFADGPLLISIELNIQSRMADIVGRIDASWIVGNAPLGAVQQRPSRPGQLPVTASSKIAWKGERCGIQTDIKPNEKRFVILEAVATHAGTLQLDPVYVQWHSRTDTAVSGSITLPAGLLNVSNARPVALNHE